MDSAPHSGSHPDPSATSGRHHRAGTAVGWTPAASATPIQARRHAKPTTSPVQDWPSPIRPPIDRLVDSGVTGLRTFNLGSVPASVTPPRTWRRAAWFTIFASAGALIGLLFTMSALVGPVHNAGRIIALPGLPTGLLNFEPNTLGPTRGNRFTNHPARVNPADGTAPAIPMDPDSGTSTLGLNTQLLGSETGNAASGSIVASVSNSTSPDDSAPTVTTVSTGAPAPVANPSALANRTEEFFSEVTTNVNAAAELTSDTVRDNAVALIRQRYGDYSAIQVQSITLDPSNGLTVSVLRMTHKDGTTSIEQETLHFTPDTNPKIENPGG